MNKLTSSTLSLATLKRAVKLQVRDMAKYEWIQTDAIVLTNQEQQRLQELSSDLLYYPVLLMNEATLLARALYPLLLLAEQPPIRALVEVTLQARYAQFEIEGIADLALAKSVSGFVESPYLIVVETKRGVEGQNPVVQLYAQLLAAAQMNWVNDNLPQQEIFGCYTIADTWTFVRTEVGEMEADIPTLRVEYSREYTEKLEAETIVKILKRIVSKYVKPSNLITNKSSM
jgi:hypothetical protein